MYSFVGFLFVCWKYTIEIKEIESRINLYLWCVCDEKVSLILLHVTEKIVKLGFYVYCSFHRIVLKAKIKHKLPYSSTTLLTQGIHFSVNWSASFFFKMLEWKKSKENSRHFCLLVEREFKNYLVMWIEIHTFSMQSMSENWCSHLYCLHQQERQFIHVVCFAFILGFMTRILYNCELMRVSCCHEAHFPFFFECAWHFWLPTTIHYALEIILLLVFHLINKPYVTTTTKPSSEIHFIMHVCSKKSHKFVYKYSIEPPRPCKFMGMTASLLCHCQ